MGRRPTAAELDRLEQHHQLWRATIYPEVFVDAAGQPIPWAPEHDELWDWIWALRPGHRPDAFVAIWPRGRGKSTNLEMGAIAAGATGRRRYAWIVSDTQPQADGHVDSVGQLLEDPDLAAWYPSMAKRAVGKYGSSRGWRRNRLATEAGFIIDAVGLDTAARGVRFGKWRPDLLIIDDVDDTLDSPDTTRKKLRALLGKIIPAGAPDRAIAFVQNLVHPRSIAAHLAGVADTESDLDLDAFRRRHLSWSVAIRGLDYEWDATTERYRITAGEPTWQGQPLGWAEDEINDIGPTAFGEEYQHDAQPPAGGMFDHIDFTALRVDAAEVPDLRRTTVAVDPAVTDRDSSDSHAIQVDGITDAGTIYRLWSWEQRANVTEALERAIVAAARFGALEVIVETDQGGDTWLPVFREAKRNLLAGDTVVEEFRHLDDEIRNAIRTVRFAERKAGAGYAPKVHRASQMVPDYELARFRHVIGTHLTLERALRRFPKTKPLDLVDAGFWSWDDLRNAPEVAADQGAGQEQPEVDPYGAERRSALWGNRPATRPPKKP